MTASLVYEHGKLIGAIPVEKRTIIVGKDQYIRALWVSGAHVDLAYRRHGLGSELDKRLGDYFSKEFSGVFVYRGEPDSLAFKWYVKNNYEVINSILALEWTDEGIPVTKPLYKVTSEKKKVEAKESWMYLHFQSQFVGRGGYVERTPGYWSQKAEIHLYRDHYRYFFLFIDSEPQDSAYSFFGETSIGDGIRRLDIFEFVASGTNQNSLLDAIICFARDKKISNLRIRFERTNPYVDWFLDQGFCFQREFFTMVRYFEKDNGLSVGTKASHRAVFLDHSKGKADHICKADNSDKVCIDDEFVKDEDVSEDTLQTYPQNVKKPTRGGFDFSEYFHCDYV